MSKRLRDPCSPQLARRCLVADRLGVNARAISIDRLPEESIRIQPKLIRREPSEDSPAKRAIQLLLKPNSWTQSPINQFQIATQDIFRICDIAQDILQAEPTLLQLSAPIKVFGDLHGQFADLMRLFSSFGAPQKETGDIGVLDYLFLGDFVDRGSNSLETIILLLALKCENPNSIYLVRGNHESMEVNARDGFLHECTQRLGDVQLGINVWKRLNKLFEWLPMGATVNGVILCVHGGIGRTLQSVDEIAALRRPLRMGGANQDILLDLLWSDPTKNDAVQGVHMNDERGSPVVCFGPDRVANFLERNKLKLIVRAHECVMDGFQRFAGGQLVTIFSATNYCARYHNAGAILLIGKNLEITPKMIFPVDTVDDAWLSRDTNTETLQHMRPPTPPRDDERELEDAHSAAFQTAPRSDAKGTVHNPMKVIRDGEEEKQQEEEDSMPSTEELPSTEDP